MQMSAADESVGDSEGPIESQFAVSESALAEGCCLQLGGLQLRELKAVKARVKTSLQSLRARPLGSMSG